MFLKNPVLGLVNVSGFQGSKVSEINKLTDIEYIASWEIPDPSFWEFQNLIESKEVSDVAMQAMMDASAVNGGGVREFDILFVLVNQAGKVVWYDSVYYVTERRNGVDEHWVFIDILGAASEITAELQIDTRRLAEMAGVGVVVRSC